MSTDCWFVYRPFLAYFKGFLLSLLNFLPLFWSLLVDDPLPDPASSLSFSVSLPDCPEGSLRFQQCFTYKITQMTYVRFSSSGNHHFPQSQGFLGNKPIPQSSSGKRQQCIMNILSVCCRIHTYFSTHAVISRGNFEFPNLLICVYPEPHST